MFFSDFQYLNLMTSSAAILDFGIQNGRHDVIELSYRNLRKTTPAHVLETICVKFHQNRPSRLGCRAVTHTQTHRQPGSILTYSVKMTEYKNVWFS